MLSDFNDYSHPLGHIQSTSSFAFVLFSIAIEAVADIRKTAEDWGANIRLENSMVRQFHDFSIESVLISISESIFIIYNLI